MGMDQETYIKNSMWENCGDTGTDFMSMLEDKYEKGKIGSATEFEYTFRHAETGESKRFRRKIYPLAEKNGRVAKLIGLTHDITKDKKIQNRLSKALKEAESANNAKRDFLSRMGHEIRTPINAIIGMMTIAEMSAGNEAKVRDCLRKIDVASKHLLGLVNDILDMSKIESGKMRIVYAVFDLEESINDLKTIALQRANEKDINLRIEAAGLSHKMLFGDDMRIKQIILNFLTNAIKFTPEGGDEELIDRQYGEDSEGIVTKFTVIDTGPGIREEFLEKIFVPFERIMSTGQQLWRHRAGDGDM
jgi:signal transduction histidine kinase